MLLAQIAGAQQQTFNFINFSNNNGLSSNTVNALLKDKLGYMWFATEDGLNKFDGISFTVYNHNNLDTSSIATNQIQTIYEDPAGNLWIGTNRTLSLYDRKKDCFQNFDITNGTAVRSICSDGAGHLWIGCYAGLILYDPASRHTKYYTKDAEKPDRLLSNTITCVFRDSRRRTWVGSNSGLYLYQPSTDNFKRFYTDPADPGSISDNVIKAIAEDRDGRLWFGTNNGGLNLLQGDDCHFTRYTSNKADVHSLSSLRIYSIVPESSGDLWIGTEEGLNIFDPRTGSVVRVTGNDRNKYSLKGSSVRSIFIDKQGIYWVCTYMGGINKYDRNLGFFNLVQYNSFDPKGLSCPKVTSFSEGNNGDIYVGTDGGGLNLYHCKTGLIDHIPLSNEKKTEGVAVLALERCGNELWIGTFQHGIFVLNTRDQRVRHITKGSRPQDLPGDDVFCLKKDRRGNIWVGTNGNGVCMFEPGSGKFIRFGQVAFNGIGSNLLKSGFIRAIEEDNAGNMVIGTVGSGVALYDPARQTCRIFNRANTNLPLDEVISLHLDAKGTIWAGTSSGGLCRLDHHQNRFANYAEQQGLANAVIYKILEDDAGLLWVSTNKGISCFDPARSTFKNYTSRNGLQQSSFYLGAGVKTSSGELFYGGLEGFNYFHPAAINDNQNASAIVFTDLKIAGQPVVPGKDAAIKAHISVAGEIRLDYKQNFSVDFATLDFTTPLEDRYMYKLSGFDRSWNEVGTSRTATFTNLYPGNYTLEVKAKNYNGGWITRPATIKIYVKPPFWMTGYAYASYIIIIAFLLWMFRSRGIRRLKSKFALEQERLQMKQMIRQERQEAERLHEFDQLRIKFLTNLSHEFRTPISLILGPLEKLRESEADQYKQEQLTMVKRNARRLLNLVNQLLDFRKLEEHELKLNCIEADIVPFIRETAESFRDIAERKQIHFAFRTEVGQFYTSFDKEKIERILFNLLGNAFKFTGKEGKISLELMRVQPTNELVIKISDTGIGMSADERQRIFDRFFQGNTHASVMNQGSGIGLAITKEFVQLQGGTISVESEPGTGSIFTICLPLKNLPQEGKGIADHPHVPGNIAEEKPAMTPATDMLTVLLVEDNEDFRYYLKDNLRSQYKVIEAGDGKEGWQKAISGHPDVIVSDISMPHMDGIELSRKIRSDKRVNHIPIILLTALNEDAYQLKGLETGASDYLTKPFSFEILRVKIRNLIMLNHRLRETYTRRLNVETPVTAIQSDNERLLLTVTQFIESNLDSPNLSVEELSRHVHMSHASLYRKIVDLTGETPVEFIRSIKLNKAADLLMRSDMKIAEVGYAVGFTTPNYFTRAFKAKFNLSPTEYVSLKRKQVS
ncbi:two-component regulator propeller domain-containing protein [Flavitalea sp. BT771]|uniref:hybrid sensor histidine kinase/response regulator transcription factor n=1 Tax=Flavitalea sp. BT771 TaxID=3063329 RepID=UPI0026E1D63C|nr:hybrid sensor histidine kinase/response regulator transcription factor [Flavitalea sp. BT771]MDO6434784.1 two-component regulator propeller domain-containing protein [Flavitalea sp. BT771]MDV6223684.1 two-component regulator propeller domain-containing protein [Flavitalea sp. BT771]